MTQKPSEPADQQLSDDNDDVPEHIQRLYDTPQEQWGVEQWREMSLYLLGELQEANSFIRSLNSDNASSLAMPAQLLAGFKKGARHAKVLSMLDHGMADGTIKVSVKRLRRRPGPAKKFDIDTCYVIVEYSRRFGMHAARRIAEIQLASDAHGGRINQDKLRQRIKTWRNRISAAKKKVREEAR